MAVQIVSVNNEFVWLSSVLVWKGHGAADPRSRAPSPASKVCRALLKHFITENSTECNELCSEIQRKGAQAFRYPLGSRQSSVRMLPSPNTCHFYLKQLSHFSKFFFFRWLHHYMAVMVAPLEIPFFSCPEVVSFVSCIGFLATLNKNNFCQKIWSNWSELYFQR